MSKGYAVHGIIRRVSSFTTGRIDHVFDRLTLYYGDVLDPMSIRTALSKARPDEVYNLAAQSHVKTSFDQPVYSAECAAMGTMNVLEAVRDYRDSTGNGVRYYQASSSEMFGHPETGETKFNEDTPFRPRSPYACAKVYAFHQTRNYREAYDLFACNGILFNHESPRRGETFVTRKITRAVGRIRHKLQDELRLGNLSARRDWGFAGDYVKAMWLMLQHDTADDYVVATGTVWSVDDWLAHVLHYADLGHEVVHVDPKYMRPTDVEYLCGDASKARRVLGWNPQVTVDQLCRMMTEHDLELAEAEAYERQRKTQAGRTDLHPKDNDCGQERLGCLPVPQV